MKTTLYQLTFLDSTDGGWGNRKNSTIGIALPPKDASEMWTGVRITDSSKNKWGWDGSSIVRDK